MISKKFLWVALAAAAALLVAPAGASAWMFNYEGKGIEKPISISLKGSFNWTSSFGNGIDCKETTTTLDVETLDAKVTNVHIDTTKCEGTGIYKGCKVTGETKTNLPWTAVPTKEEWHYLLGSIDYEVTCGGTLLKPSVSWESITGKVDNPSAIKTETVSGTGTSGLETVTFSGKYEVVGEAAGKLSIVE